VFDEDLPEFLKGFDQALKVFEKTIREQKRAAHAKPHGGGHDRAGDAADGERRPPASGKKIVIARKKPDDDGE
jgi:hypothetical protein